MIGSIGFGYIEEIDREHVKLIEKLENVEASDLTDAQQRKGTMDPRIKPIRHGSMILGPAVTVDLPLGDNLMLYVALKLVQPGDVLVITTNGNYSKAVWGELMTRSAEAKKLGGIIIDGLIRDVAANQKHKLPIFCCGSVPVSVEKNGPGFVNGEVSCGGITVQPGDIIAGNDDGVVVIKKENLTTVINNIERITEREKERVKEIENGKVLPSWLDRKMESIGLVNEAKNLE